jgi:1,4-alpha-glucan branching enzyme
MEEQYRFTNFLGEIDEYLISEGTHHELWRVLGSHVRTHEGVIGTYFAVWAPNAQRLAIVGDFNGWDPRVHYLRRRGSTAVWEIFLPGVGEGDLYKYAITGPDGLPLPLKADPVGFRSQHPPEDASVVCDITGYGWRDAEWMKQRAAANDRTAPISIYEVHLGSWRRKAEGRRISYREAAGELVDYVVEMGFTHLELLPISEYPFDGSWGYQPLGLYAPTVRHGPPHEFRDLIDAAHLAGLGVILDWVPGHFPTDEHGLSRFDGTSLYEHADPKEGFHRDWNTLIYNYGRPEVRNYLIANALYWLEEYHIDGLRVDAVASMLYRDYSRRTGEWVPNADGGNENYEAVDFLRAMNVAAYGTHPGILTVAEESTSFPKVSAPVHDGGLGFGFKWNMGWMNDTLRYMAEDPINRKHHHDKLTFGLHCAFLENFVLPISHDEVVHGKRSMYGRMPGDHTMKLANLRAYYGFMWGHPGKKLLFMGQEFGQVAEWNHDAEIGWHHLDDPLHKGLQRLVRDLNTLYRTIPAMHVKDAEASGFEWLIGNDAAHSVVAWVRHGAPADKPVVMITNFTQVEWPNYRIGLPLAGRWRVVLNTDALLYGGGNRGTMERFTARDHARNNQRASAHVYLPPLTTLFLIPDP